MDLILLDPYIHGVEKPHGGVQAHGEESLWFVAVDVGEEEGEEEVEGGDVEEAKEHLSNMQDSNPPLMTKKDTQ